MTRRLILSVVWAYAALVWGSMAHVFLGLPDVGPVVGPTLFAAIVLLPLARPGPGRANAQPPTWSRVRWWFQAGSRTDT